MPSTVWIWAGFVALVLVLLSLDLFVFHRKAHVVKVREALLWSGFWIALALIFNVAVYFMYENHFLGLGLKDPATGEVRTDAADNQPLNGANAAAKFLTGYVVEKSLSVDNLFVIALLFGYFAIPPMLQHRVLFWGIVGALVMRGLMIGVGATLIQRFSWILLVFGVFLIYTAWKMLTGDLKPDPENNTVIRWARKVFPVTTEIHGTRFLVREGELGADEKVLAPGSGGVPGSADLAHAVTPATDDATASAATAVAAPVTTATSAPASASSSGKWVLTPLALALISVETTDLIFAVDSIPAIFAITTDPFLVFTSNIFAILGLRSLYFALAGVMEKFKYLNVSLAAILALVGVKMLAGKWLHQIHGMSFYMLGLIFLILGAGVVASIIAARRDAAAGDVRA